MKHPDLIIAEIHKAINKLGGSAQPATPNDADRVLRDLGADIDLISIVDSWQDTLPDEDILQLLRNWNAGVPLFQTIYASRPDEEDSYQLFPPTRPRPFAASGPAQLREISTHAGSPILKPSLRGTGGRCEIHNAGLK